MGFWGDSSQPPTTYTIFLLQGLLTIGTFSLQPVWARPEGVNKPELLPKERSNVIDLERFLTSGQKKRLSQQLDALEKDSGIKVRLLCQRYPDTPGLAIKDYWGLDDKSIVVVADKGPANIKQVATRNLLNFNVGSGLQLLLPPAFWNRLRSQFGSIFYLRSHGDDEAIIATINTIDTCIRLKGCVDVPKGAAEEEGVFSFLK
ncbi:hypothetical protein NSK_008055 [Nannochloropsis salina CCMP1776]|uniref:TPM domain-containing protein n=1 Tax=Nannochloropsis salina CCMP1776 TaxID=1027361 RepID=A0A4D9CVD4_9STRA|nr:hypothetical protein NSK_008055 [Nannochloropsis salina CCMP1776]|eukprot:TFJ80629.1 hypothetical protein NSK_008055 [Nannochloropsis salina CCMP1776]